MLPSTLVWTQKNCNIQNNDIFLNTFVDNFI